MVLQVGTVMFQVSTTVGDRGVVGKYRGGVRAVLTDIDVL